MSFRVTGLPAVPFAPLFDLDDAALAEIGARRVIAESDRGFPCRVSLEDARAGEELLLLNHEHQPAPGPFRSRHAIFVRRRAVETFDRIDVLPPVFAGRLLSLRGFSAHHMMIAAECAQGEAAQAVIDRLLAVPEIAYLHVHFAAYGCYAARLERC
jgi:hypothetical protein